MTEQEALELGKKLYANIINNENNIIKTNDYIEFAGMTIKALEEIQQYRAIGTLEECMAAVEKQKAIKPHKNFERFSGVWCSCGNYLGKAFIDKPNYCSDCGTKLDWSDGE